MLCEVEILINNTFTYNVTANKSDVDVWLSDKDVLLTAAYDIVANDENMAGKDITEVLVNKCYIIKENEEQRTSNDGVEDSEDETETNDKAGFKWKKTWTRMLLVVRLEMEPQFTRPSCKKKKLWRKIAERVARDAGIKVTGDQCDMKYRNLMTTYKANKKKKAQSGEGAVNWEFFNQMDEVLGCKASSLPPTETLVESLNPSTANVTPDTELLDDSNELEDIPPPSPSSASTASGSKKKLSITDYLKLKLEHDEKKEKARQVHKEKMWEEKKKLKEKEINCYLELIKAIGKQE